MKLRGIDLASLILVVVGGLNWGLIGLFNWNLVSAIFGVGVISRIIYVLVGASAVYAAVRSPHLAHLHKPVPSESHEPQQA